MPPVETEKGLQAAADHINDAVARYRPSDKPIIRQANLRLPDVIKYQRSVRRCAAKWVADQVKEEVK